MNLSEFIAETLLQVVEGVKDAQARTSSNGARVNPHLTTSAEHAVKQNILIASGEAAQLVQFDVALTATEGTETKGGIGVVAGIFNLGSAGLSQAASSTISRVKFVVPLVLPREPRG